MSYDGYILQASDTPVYFMLFLISLFQLSCYDQFKQLLLLLPVFNDNIITHFTASFLAVSLNTLYTMGCLNIAF